MACLNGRIGYILNRAHGSLPPQAGRNDTLPPEKEKLLKRGF